MKIAILGTRGVPAHYGGFETCAEEISTGLVERGHRVTVYCRHGNSSSDEGEYKGVRLVYVPCLKTKIFGTLSHSFFSFLHSLFHDYDILMVFNVAASPLCVIPKMFFKKIVLNVDGMEWKRRKWGAIGRRYYQACASLAFLAADRIVADAEFIQEYYENKFNTSSTFIAYGAREERPSNPEILKEYTVEKNKYFFVLCRLEPENNTDLVVKAFETVKTDKKLLVVGGVNYKSAFVENLKKTKDKRIVFFGPVYNKEHIKELYCNAYAYVHGHEAGGTSLALLQAMGSGNCILAFNGLSNAEVVGSSAILWDRSPDDLAGKMQYINDNPGEADKYRVKALERAKEYYSWDAIVDKYEGLFKKVSEGYYRTRKRSD